MRPGHQGLSGEMMGFETESHLLSVSPVIVEESTLISSAEERLDSSWGVT